MKNISKKLGASFILSFCALSAGAVDWVYDLSKGDAIWSESLGSSTVDGYWKDSSSGEYIKGSYSESDTFYVGDTSSSVMTETRTLTLDSDINVAAFNVAVPGGSIKLNLLGVTDKFINFNVAGDFINHTTSGYPSVLVIKNVNMHIGGDLHSGTHEFEIKDSYQIKVDGNFIGASAKPLLAAFGTIKERIANGTNTLANGLASPDVVIKGIVSNNNNFRLVSGESAGLDSYYKVGGITTSSVHLDGGHNTVSHLTLALASGQNLMSSTWGGGINEQYNMWWRAAERARIMVIMDSAADATQGIWNAAGTSISSSMFTGGVYIKNGNLRVFFNQAVSGYSFQCEGWATRTVTYTLGDKDGDQTITTSSHGDLTMEGGSFGSVDENNGIDANINTYGAFRFTNIIYKGGKIKLRCVSEDKIDSIDLTSYYEKSVLVSDSTDVIYTKEGGGTIKFADDVADGTKVTFDFDSATKMFLVDNESNDGKGIKIVSWDATSKTELLDSDFYATGYSNSGEDYFANFAVADDGLYVKYTQVPEPATIAAIFGVAALLFAAYRRRK